MLGRMNAAMAETMKSEQGLAGLEKFGMELDNVTAEAFAVIVKADYERYRGIVRASGFKPED